MLNLPQITLCCVDTKYPLLGLYALRQSMRKITFGEVIFLTNINELSPHEQSQLPIRTIAIDPIKSVEEYSTFILKSLLNYIATPYVLLIQWDGYVIDPRQWSDMFLSFDYIGAPWLLKDGSRLVGNGGFSLRSKKLLGALLSEGIQYHHPEDDCIAKTNRALLEQKFNIRFADPNIAEKFSYEFTKPLNATFGFHGFSNFPDVMPLTDLNDFVRSMPGNLVFNGYFPKFLHCLHNKTASDPSYEETMHLIQNIIINALHSDDRAPEKSLIKSLIKCNLHNLAKEGLKSRMRATGYTKTNIRLLARYITDKYLLPIKKYSH